MRDTLLPPLYGTKHLHIQIESHVKHPDVVGIVDSLLRFSPQVDTLSFCGNVELEMLKFTYRDAADDEDEKPCCASLPWKCWRHELKKVELQQNIGLKERLDLEKYFLTNADMLEIIDEQREWRNHSDPVVWQLELPSWW